MSEELDSGSTVADVVESAVVAPAAPSAAPAEPSFDMDKGSQELSDQLGFGKQAGEVAKETADAAKAVEAAAGTGVIVAPPPSPGAPVDPTATPPKTWTKEAGETWATIPPAAKAEILRREEDMFKGIEGYKAKASFGESVVDVLKPYMPAIMANSINPVNLINNLLASHNTLALGSQEQKLALWQNLAKTYGMTVTSAGEEGSPAYVDPKVASLEAKIAQLESGQAQTEQARRQQYQEDSTKAVNAFATDPAHPYFDECSDEIARLIRSGEGKDLADAYEKAVWLNPVTRTKEVARQNAEKQTKLGEDAAKKLLDAKTATAANVNTRPKAVTAGRPLGSMDDTMMDTLRSIKAR